MAVIWNMSHKKCIPGARDIKLMVYLIVIIIFTKPSARAGYETRSIFKRSLTGLNQSFPSPRLIASPRLKDTVCPTYYPKVLVLCEMQSVLSRIWTRVIVSKSYDDNHYTTGTYLIVIISASKICNFFFSCLNDKSLSY